MAHKPRVAVFLSSVRPERMCARVAKFVEFNLLKSGYDVDVIDPLALKLPLLEKALHHYPDPKDAPKVLIDTNAKIVAADAYVIVSAEYNHSVPPALSNLLAHFPSASYAYKPSAIVCYSMGPFAGVRAAMQLRAMLSELDTPSVPTLCPVPTVHLTLDADGKTKDETLLGIMHHMIDQLKWYAEALKHQRSKGVPKK